MVWARPDGRTSITGLRRCGSVWECSECGQRIGLRRRHELERLAERHRATGGEVYHLTLTARHASGHDLRAMREHMAKAWAACISGEPWRRLAAKIGFSGFVRALDVTIGAHGWHPHLHVLVLTGKPLRPRELAALRRRMRERWSRAIVRLSKSGSTLTAPSRQHGVRLVRAMVPAYLAEASITWSDELASATMKKARNGNRTPWQVLHQLTRGKYATRAERNADESRWKAWATDMRGAKQLSWSKGLKKKYQVEKADEQGELDLAPAEVLRLVIPADEWNLYIRPFPDRQADVEAAAGDWELSAGNLRECVAAWIEGARARAGPTYLTMGVAA